MRTPLQALTAISLLLACAAPARAGDSPGREPPREVEYALSERISVRWPADWNVASVPLLGLGGAWLQGRRFTAWVSTTRLDGAPTLESARAEHRGGLRALSPVAFEDLGCDAPSPGRLRCLSEGRDHGRHLVQTVHWLGARDLVLVRVESSRPLAEVRAIARTLEPKGALP